MGVEPDLIEACIGNWHCAIGGIGAAQKGQGIHINPDPLRICAAKYQITGAGIDQKIDIYPIDFSCHIIMPVTFAR